MIARKVDVLWVNRSVMNARRWCLALVCGHDLWVTATRRPRAKAVSCPKCRALCPACRRARESKP